MLPPLGHEEQSLVTARHSLECPGQSCEWHQHLPVLGPACRATWKATPEHGNPWEAQLLKRCSPYPCAPSLRMGKLHYPPPSPSPLHPHVIPDAPIPAAPARWNGSAGAVGDPLGATHQALLPVLQGAHHGCLVPLLLLLLPGRLLPLPQLLLVEGELDGVGSRLCPEIVHPSLQALGTQREPQGWEQPCRHAQLCCSGDTPGENRILGRKQPFALPRIGETNLLCHNLSVPVCQTYGPSCWERATPQSQVLPPFVRNKPPAPANAPSVGQKPPARTCFQP